MAYRRRIPKPEQSITILVPPIQLKIDNCIATLIESLKYETIYRETRYFVAVKVKCNNKESPIFRVDVKNEEELMWKLRSEISKLKLLEASGV